MNRRPLRSTLFPYTTLFRSKSGDAVAYVKGLLDQGERLMGFGHRVYRAEDPRARVLRRTAKELDAPRYEVRSEEHTSELQSQFQLVCRLPLEKKKRAMVIRL